MEYLSVETKDKLCRTDTLSSDNKRKLDSSEVDIKDDEVQQNKKVKLKGRNKQRPFMLKISDSEKMCPTVLQEQECRYGTKCKFCHDIATFMKTKPEDLGQECYNFKTFGRCPFGFACRFAKHHISPDFKNITNQELFNKTSSEPQVFNTLSKDLQHLLWKKKYDFTQANKIVNSYYDSVRKEKLQQKSDVIAEQETHCDSLASEKTFGCITDEEIIRLRPQEKKLVCIFAKAEFWF